MPELQEVGLDWVQRRVSELVDSVEYLSPSEFAVKHRVLPASVSPLPGPMSFDVNPFLVEPINTMDVRSPIRETYVKKGVQITYTTGLESVLLYFMAYIKTSPIMFMTADKEIADLRVDNNIVPMLRESGFLDIIQASDGTDGRKTGKTKDQIQFIGGGFLLPFGAKNANKQRSFSIRFLLMDEVDGWPTTVGTAASGGKEGDPMKLAKHRTNAFARIRKIFVGSTPKVKGLSKIDEGYERGDQRKYFVRCKACDHAQPLRWETKDDETGVEGGFKWDLDENGRLIETSVRWCCAKCGEPHFEHDKEKLFSPKHGAEWVPTATPVAPYIRSYHLPGLYSPVGMQSWADNVLDWLECFDPTTGKVVDYDKYQQFYNNVLGEAFRLPGTRIKFEHVSLHRRPAFVYGEIPNKFAEQYCGSPVLFLTCTVDVHKDRLNVAVIGWCRDARSFLVDYSEFHPRDDERLDCTDDGCSVWSRLRELIDDGSYVSDDGIEYRLMLTFIDAGYEQATVKSFCSDYLSGVHPILGRDRPSKNQRINEFGEWAAQDGMTGYRITVDHYKDRLAPMLRKEWIEELGVQGKYHFNAPMDATDAQMKELTRETRVKKTDERTGQVSYYWHRPEGADNELWDLLVYGHAAVEIIAYNLCIQYFKLESVEWDRFWDYMVEQWKLLPRTG